MLNLAEFQSRPKSLADYLPWGFLVAPGVVLNKDGSFQKTLRYRGPDLASATAEEMVSVTARINNVLRRFGTGWSLYFEAARVAAPDYPASHFDQPLAWLIDEERRAGFERDGRYFESSFYLTFQYLPPEDRTSRLDSLLLDRSDESTATGWQDHLTEFTDQVRQAIDLLNGAMPLVAELDDRETLTYLHDGISSKKHNVNVPDVPAYLDCLVADEALTCGLEPKLGDRHLRVLTILGLPGTGEPGLLDALNHLGFPYRWMTRFIALDKRDAQVALEKARRHWFAKRKSVLSLLREAVFQEPAQLLDSDAENKAADADLALQDLGSDAVSFGFVTTSVVVAENDADVAEARIAKVAELFNARGFVTINETVNAVDAWLGSLPGQPYANVRQPLIHTLNLAHFCPLSAVWAGPQENAHLAGPPVMQVATEGATPFRLVTHQGDVGHMMVVGPTGAGKSVLLNLLMAQFLRYEGAQVFFFDKGASARAMVLGLRGTWLDVAEPDDIALQPLKSVDHDSHRGWALDWLLLLLTGEGLEVTPEQKDLLWTALNALADVPEHERTLTGLSLLVQDQAIRTALQPFTLEGAFGAVLDSDCEEIGFARVTGFEMDRLMQTKRLVLPVLDLLFHRLEERFRGSPSLLILDEAWLFLDHPVFAGKIREWLKTLRKKNVSVIFATQSLADVAMSTIAPALIDACPTRIFLPNSAAVEQTAKETYERFGLNQRQIEIIASAAPKRDYYYQSSDGNRLFDLTLGEVALAFCGASSATAQQEIDAVLAQHGGAGFPEKWLEHHGLSWAAQLFAGRCKEESTHA
ncbi:conjugal transfer protein TrbE [Parvularcula sp. IMCC14364]|uniref:conjugal transfer protein TrbE n=1 Tax=Parvularcula sp. IMCC14364 TaxID=3067902 RepID=UPI0027415704|nr:conjugal transfer protein TrbE [Parvularcula sp. IMCC14364]